MAAMFQAQTANWEETQEKMSQLVSRFSAFIVLRSISISHERDFYFLPLRIAPTASNKQCPAYLF